MTLFDAGLQPERTELAWRRTAIASAVGSLVALRLLPEALADPWWSLVGVAGLAASAGLLLAARHRHRAVIAALARDGDRAALPDARLLAVSVGMVVASSLVGLALVLVAAVGS